MLRKIIYWYKLVRSSPKNRYLVYKKYLDIKFGENVRILHFPRFGSEPFLIEMGDNVTITRGVSFITHDGGVTLFRDEYPGLNVFGPIKIGSNVFIGINAIILPGVQIGSNVVIGAGSIINKDIPDNVVVAGIPAKVISTLKDYKAKVLNKSIIVQSKTKPEKKEEIINKVLLKTK